MTLEEARSYFSGDRYSTECTGIGIDAVGKHYSKCSLTLNEKHMNACGFVMGAVYYTLADFSFAVATESGRETLTVTTVGQISYLDICRGKKLIAECRALREGAHMCYYVVNITDENGTLAATVNISGMHVAVR